MMEIFFLAVEHGQIFRILIYGGCSGGLSVRTGGLRGGQSDEISQCGCEEKWAP